MRNGSPTCWQLRMRSPNTWSGAVSPTGSCSNAVRVRLIEIGEAVRAIDPAVLASEPDVPWQDVAGMRNHLAHRYFDTDHAIVAATVEHDLPPLVAAARRLLDVIDG